MRRPAENREPWIFQPILGEQAENLISIRKLVIAITHNLPQIPLSVKGFFRQPACHRLVL